VVVVLVVGGAVVAVVDVVVLVVGGAVVAVVDVVVVVVGSVVVLVDVLVVVGSDVVLVDVVLVVDVGPARAASARAIHNPTANSIDTIFSALLMPTEAPPRVSGSDRTCCASVAAARLVACISVLR
jgi:hypothetical protein